MTQYERNLSNLSYTNKDFGQIYPELLDLVKKISYKWDPSQSDESDPGVILLKLAALMADKNNYNIDKNILETFPLSVTQLQNARQVFEQCGYCMKYYQSATVSLSMTLKKEPELTPDSKSILSPDNPELPDEDLDARIYVIPKFTMISDVDNSVVYTVLQDVKLSSSGLTIDGIPAIQGIYNSYTINGQTTITSANLDYNNRLYFTELDIPENGIFITDDTRSTWTKVDNLVLQPNGTRCYKFGLTEDGSRCYIEFPNDIDSLMGKGISINYLRTQGFDGNIGKKRLSHFYTDVSATRYIDPIYPEYDVMLTTYEGNDQGNVYITNIDSAHNGRNPESINDAYRNYQKIKTTFETLVSLRDYENFLYTNKNVSNGFVCDRTNDIQSSYKVLNSDETNVTTSTYIYADENNNPEMTPFDLRVYGLTYVDNPTTTEGFNRSFTVINQNTDANVVTSWLEILRDTEDIKCIQHNYKAFEKNRILMLMNRYPIISRIIPQYKLEPKQQAEVINAIVSSLYKVLNSRVLDFGAEIEYDVVYDAIMNADPRIRAITLNDLEYTTYAVYCGDDNELHELRIDSESICPTSEPEATLWHDFRTTIYARSVLAGRTQLHIPDNKFTYSLNQSESDLKSEIYRVTTNTDIVATRREDQTTEPSDKVVYKTAQIGLNENIIFTAPNMIEDTPYSSYVKFIYNIGLGASARPAKSETTVTTVGKDSCYTLTGDEYIAFFWKTEDDDDAPYQYIKYTAGSAINTFTPNFSLPIQCNPDNRTLPPIPDALISKLPAGKRGSTDTVTQTVSGHILQSGIQKPVTMSFTDYISKLTGSSFVLTGTRKLTTKRPNTIHINGDTPDSKGTRDIYWILNNSNDGWCTLFSKDSLEYTLGIGEYFMYSNAERTQLYVLGSGTRITRDATSTYDWKCPAIDYDQFISESLDYLDNKWFTIDRDVNVYATEMQFYQLGPGNWVQLTCDANIPNLPEQILFNRNGTFDQNGEEFDLHNFTIGFISDVGADITPLSDHNSPETAWVGRSILNLNVSPSTSQTLSSDQSIELYDSRNRLISTMSDVNLLTSRSLALTGGDKTDVTTIDLVNDKIIPLELYSYVQLSLSDIGGGWSFDGFTTSATIPSASNHEQSLTCSLPAGNYILPFELSADVADLQIVINDIPVYAPANVTYNTKGIHRVKFSLDGEQGEVQECKVVLKSTFVAPDADTPAPTITFSSPFKYVVELTDEDMKSVTDLIEYSLDSEHIFNYTYIVPEADLIEDPLSAIEFLNPNHVFNPYTICRWDTETDSNKIVVINKIK